MGGNADQAALRAKALQNRPYALVGRRDMRADVVRPVRKLYFLFFLCKAVNLGAHSEKTEMKTLCGELLQRDRRLRPQTLQDRPKRREIYGFLASHNGVVMVEYQAAAVRHVGSSDLLHVHLLVSYHIFF